MEGIKLSIAGFKCFKNKTDFKLNNITLLTGANSAGKSTVIQSMILNRIASLAEHGADCQLVEVELNNSSYALELGTYDDIVYHDKNYQNEFSIDTNVITFGIEDVTTTIDDINNVESEKTVQFSINQEFSIQVRKLFSKGFVYLNADRMAPQYEYRNSENAEFCDCHGGNTGNVIQKHENDNCEKIRAFDFSEDKKWGVQLNKWIDYIFPQVAIQILPSSSDSYQVKVLGKAATNVGFGITYALPILVSGLLVPKDGVLIVENPEAHLHAKAQSNMGYFLARMAAAGIRVIIETHSEHIVNGIRRMIVEGDTSMSHNDVTIYFFQNKNGEKNPLEINMDKNGNLSKFPEDFFDKVRQDTLAMLRIDRKKKEQKNG